MGNSNLFNFFHYLNWSTIAKTYSYAKHRRLTGLASEMAYNAMLSLFPGILAILTAIGIFEDSLANSLGDVAIKLKGIVPEAVWMLLANSVQDLKLKQPNSLFSISFIAAIWIFSGVLSAAMEALEQIHQMPKQNKRPFWKAKLVAILLTIGTIILLIIVSFLVLIGDFLIQFAVEQNWVKLLLSTWQLLSLVVFFAILSAAIFSIYQVYLLPRNAKNSPRRIQLICLIIITTTILLEILHFLLLFIHNLIITPEIKLTVISVLLRVWHSLSWPVALAIVATNFAFIYRFGISRRLKNTPIVPGAILAAVFWVIVSAIFKFYVSHFYQYHKIYGALGAVIVMMLWLYLSSLVMLLGEQLNAILGEEFDKSSLRDKIYKS